ncbi:MAG: DUF1772 domain-containing protein [Acidobacteriota bacterium]|nr:DUF1772 domain-containing protein [Acidobacteriota bacterium]
MTMFDFFLLTATLLCSLVAGFVLAFSVVVMPGIQSLNNRAYLEAFKVMDNVIQNNHPVFVIVWLGSVVALLITTVMSTWHLEGLSRILIVISSCIYVFGVQLPTFTINIPLNNTLKRLDLAHADQQALDDLSKQFDTRWIPSNTLRTVLAIVTVILLLVVIIKV